MINKASLLYPISVENRSEYEKSVIDGAQNAGHSPRFMNAEKINPTNHAGALQQFINPSAIKAAECGAPGCDSDVSDGIGSLREFFNSGIVNENA